MKSIYDFEQPDGSFLENDGLYHGDAESFLGSRLGFCGCGQPDCALEYVLHTLKHIAELKALVWEKLKTWEEWEADGQKLHGSTGAQYFIWYQLDDKGFIEHGGSVPGWLTESGEQMLRDLERWNSEREP